MIQFTRHEIQESGESDIAINFMVLPEFFDVAYSMAGSNKALEDFFCKYAPQDEEHDNSGLAKGTKRFLGTIIKIRKFIESYQRKKKI